MKVVFKWFLWTVACLTLWMILKPTINPFVTSGIIKLGLVWLAGIIFLSLNAFPSKGRDILIWIPIASFFGSLILLLWWIMGWISGGHCFHKEGYHDLLIKPVMVSNVESIDSLIEPVSPWNPMFLSKQEAQERGNRKLAQESPGHRVNELFLQKVRGVWYWIGPLAHGSLQRELIYTGNVPGFVAINAQKGDVRFIRKEIKDSRFLAYCKNASIGLTDFRFEVDEWWNPKWVATTFDSKISWKGLVATGAIVVDARSGNSERYYGVLNIPDWVDLVYSPKLVNSLVSIYAHEHDLKVTEDELYVFSSKGIYQQINFDEGFMLIDCKSKKSFLIDKTCLDPEDAFDLMFLSSVSDLVLTHNFGNGELVYHYPDDSFMCDYYDIEIKTWGEDRDILLRNFLTNKVLRTRSKSKNSNQLEFPWWQKRLRGTLFSIASENHKGDSFYHFTIEGIMREFYGSNELNDLVLAKPGDTVEIEFFQVGEVEENEMLGVYSFKNLSKFKN